IFLYDDKLVITYNYKGKRKTLKLKDIKDGSDLKESAPPQSQKPADAGFILYLHIFYTFYSKNRRSVNTDVVCRANPKKGAPIIVSSSHITTRRGFGRFAAV
ncbi:MAG: hypothetical protein RRY08_06590, partial [Christensenella sp.]